jgi:hypothetical protein
MWSGERDHGTSQLTRRMVTHKHAPDELSQQTVTDSRFARPDHHSFLGKWWFATPNRQSLAVWCSKPPELLRPVVGWHGRPHSFGGLGCKTVSIWWSGRKTVFFGGLPAQTTTGQYGLWLPATANHHSSQVAEAVQHRRIAGTGLKLASRAISRGMVTG